MLTIKRPENERGYAFASGLHFALVQNALCLAIGLFINFSLLGYFVIILSWLLGSVFGLNPFFRRFHQSGISFVCSMAVVLFTYFLSKSGLTSHMGTWVLVEFVAVIAGIQAGSFFGGFEKHSKISAILWHENNGFVLGVILSLFAFTDFGVRFLFWGPTLSWGILVVAQYFRAIYFLGTVLVFLLFLLPLGMPLRYFILGLAAVGLKLLPDPPVSKNGGEDSKLSPAHSRAILLACGFCLILLQTMVVRQFSSLLSACEVSILLVSATFMVGYSVAYRIGPLVTWHQLSRWAPAIFAIQIIYLCFGSALFSNMGTRGFGFISVTAIFLTLSFASSALFAIVLPLILGHRLGLATAYRWEITGSALAVVVGLVAQLTSSPLILPLYVLVASLLVLRLSPAAWQKPLAAGFASIFLLLVWKGGEINNFNRTVYYVNRVQAPVSIKHSSSNFYHQIDVIETPDGGRQAFLNGVRYFGNYGLNEFTFYLAELPARLQKPRKVLILGAGSLTSIRRVAPHAEEITVVEIDPEVAAVSEAHFGEYNQLDKLLRDGVKYRIVFDDARHYLRAHPDKYDLVVFDISAPYYLQTATLHTLEFFHLIRERLTEQGVFSISTSGSVGQTLGRRVASTVAKVFPNYALLSVPGVNGFLYAGAGELPWRSQQVVPQIQSALGTVPEGTALYIPEDLNPILASFAPLSLSDMSVLLDDNVRRIAQRFK